MQEQNHTKTLLLLGGFGFIGSNILSYIDQYYSNQYQVIVFDRVNTHPHGLRFSCVEKVYFGDFSDTVCLEQAFVNHRIDMVLHCLSTTVPATSNNIIFDIQSNIIPTIELLNLMVKYAVHQLIFLSSGGAIYGEANNQIPHKEDQLTHPISSYGIVKLTIEQYLYLYDMNHGIRSLSLRLSNPYGRYHYNPRQGIINVACRSAIHHEPFFVWGDGSASKDYIFIDDFCDILFRLIRSKIHHTEAINVGSVQVLSVNTILEHIHTFFSNFTWQYKEALQTDIHHGALDLSRLYARIGPYHFTPFEEGLSRTIDWLKNSTLQTL